MSEYGDKAELIKSKIQEREEFIRESWVKAMEARLVRDELVKCQRHEGVNHLESCKWLSEKYLLMLKENKVKGYKKIDF
ncbi:NADH-ubiquinone oxidoreductase 12 kDa subunit [Rhizopogon vinicolor AM-OR11-026]|uniref:NADH-ubiquinone oxidoreductase 12 kDa subunit n=1 Tax=Rhizopogon vinicolor AM-OR11-026 TaxID=1314800 RepID=A0A1B7MZJ3_9AGAM|nr:NADH-ubiquinone oxidoreductase 12 kDa subunit [Rhizopogon vinicolor AM-OR11-026]